MSNLKNLKKKRRIRKIKYFTIWAAVIIIFLSIYLFMEIPLKKANAEVEYSPYDLSIQEGISFFETTNEICECECPSFDSMEEAVVYIEEQKKQSKEEIHFICREIENWKEKELANYIHTHTAMEVASPSTIEQFISNIRVGGIGIKRVTGNHVIVAYKYKAPFQTKEEIYGEVIKDYKEKVALFEEFRGKGPLTEREKVWFIGCYIMERFAYDQETADKSESGLYYVKKYQGDDRFITCVGYAELMYVLCQEEGIECINVYNEGNSDKNIDAHALNAVKYSGENKYILYDITNADASELKYTSCDFQYYVNGRKNDVFLIEDFLSIKNEDVPYTTASRIETIKESLFHREVEKWEKIREKN